MRLYYFTGPEFAVENIEKQHLKISFPDQVNDIFEMMPFDFKHKEDRLDWRKSIPEMAKKQGFISLSGNWQSPTMWGHYAAKHTGVCYGFETSPMPSLLRMSYVEHFRSFDERAIHDENVLNELKDYALTTKSLHWAYEEEWRKLVSLDENEKMKKACGHPYFFRSFGDLSLTLSEVIIGAESNLTLKDFKTALGNKQKCRIKKARASFRDFKIVEHLDFFKR